MNIGFYLIWQDRPLFYVLADIMVHSARTMMPGAMIAQLTDHKSPMLQDVDEVRRLKTAPLPEMRAEHFANCDGDWLFVDTDVVFQKDVSGVFAQPFDIAVAQRRDNTPYEFQRGMPHNAGVIFSRSPAFWKDVLAIVSRKGTDPWYGDQKGICDVIATGKHKTLVLPASYNFAPKETSDDAADAHIVHCKGDRKDWMLSRFRKEQGLCA